MMNCPYNNTHIFKKEKFLKHLEHCNDKKNSSKKLYKCKLDSLVMFFKEEREDHYSICPCGKKDLVDSGKDLKSSNTIDQDSNILEPFGTSEDFEKSFHNASIKTTDLNSKDDESQSSIDLIDKTKLY